MAEEVIYEWNHPNELVFEAMGAGFEGESLSRHNYGTYSPIHA